MLLIRDEVKDVSFSARARKGLEKKDLRGHRLLSLTSPISVSHNHARVRARQNPGESESGFLDLCSVYRNPSTGFESVESF